MLRGPPRSTRTDTLVPYPTLVRSWSLASWESKDGGRYRFFIRRFDGSGESESVRGEAELAADGSGRAVFHAPERREVALPPGTLFPTHQDRKSTRLNSSH